jgi:hypothetical protein
MSEAAQPGYEMGISPLPTRRRQLLRRRPDVGVFSVTTGMTYPKMGVLPAWGCPHLTTGAGPVGHHKAGAGVRSSFIHPIHLTGSTECLYSARDATGRNGS